MYKIEFNKPMRYSDLEAEAKPVAIKEVWENEKKSLPLGGTINNVLFEFFEFAQKMTTWGIDVGYQGNRICMDKDEPWKVSIYGEHNINKIVTTLAKGEDYQIIQEIKKLNRINVEFKLNEIWQQNVFEVKINPKNDYLFRSSYQESDLKKEIDFIIKHDKEEIAKDKYLFLHLFSEEEKPIKGKTSARELEEDVQKVALNALNRVLSNINSYINGEIDNLKKRIKNEQEIETQLNYYREMLEKSNSDLFRKYHFDNTGLIAAEYIELKKEFVGKYKDWAFYENMKMTKPHLYGQLFPNEKKWA